MTSYKIPCKNSKVQVPKQIGQGDRIDARRQSEEKETDGGEKREKPDVLSEVESHIYGGKNGLLDTYLGYLAIIKCIINLLIDEVESLPQYHTEKQTPETLKLRLSQSNQKDHFKSPSDFKIWRNFLDRTSTVQTLRGELIKFFLTL